MDSLAFSSKLHFLRGGIRLYDTVGWKSSFAPRMSFSDSPNSLEMIWMLNVSSSCLKTRCFGVGVPRSTIEVVDDRVVEDEEKQQEAGRVLRVGLICGGPSAERGISLNSARSVLDHIQVLYL